MFLFSKYILDPGRLFDDIFLVGSKIFGVFSVELTLLYYLV